MLRAVVLLQLTIWAASVHAFFPWLPRYVCTDDRPCDKASEVIDERISRDAPKVTRYRVTQRVPDTVSDPSVRSAREASRLLRKYGNRKSTHAIARHADLTRRENNYSVVPPDPTDGKNTAGVYQDGTDFCYFIQASIGSDGKELFMLLDTGAGTTWVMGSDCQTDACKLHNSFDKSDSKTFKEQSKGFSIAYGSGTVGGSLAQDTLSVAGLDMSMTFGVANQTSDDFSHFPFDGILGLSMTTGATDNFLQVVKESRALGSNIFGVSLSRNSDGRNTGEVSFGGTDSSRYTGSISYSPVSSKAGNDWAIALDDLSYDGKNAGLKGRLAYIDTGTSFVFGPADDVAAIHKLIPGASSSDGTTYTVPCDSDQPITVIFSGVGYTVSPKDWLSGPSGDGTCTSNIYGHPVVPDAWLMGDTFLKNVYAVFDVDQRRIGFAPKPSPPPESTSSTVIASTSRASSGPAPTSDSTTTAPPTATTDDSSLPGLSGHETTVTAGGPVAQSKGASPKPTMKSPAEQLERNKYAPIIGAVAVVAMMA